MHGKKLILITIVSASFFIESCNEMMENKTKEKAKRDTIKKNDSLNLLLNTKRNKIKFSTHDTLPSNAINTSKVSEESIVEFAETLIGTPYKYGSADPQQGFDCSGFITYVYNHFNLLAELIFFAPSGQDIGRRKTKSKLVFSAVGRGYYTHIQYRVPTALNSLFYFIIYRYFIP